MRCGVLVNTILYNVAAGNRDNGVFPTVKIGRGAYLYHFEFRNVGRSWVTVSIKILVYNNARWKTYVAILVPTVTRIKHNLAVKHHKAKWLAHAFCGVTGVPRKAAVHCANNLALHILVNPVSLVEHCSRLILRCVHL